MNNRTFFGRLHEKLLERGTPEEPIDLFGSEAIKHIFDSVRNFLMIGFITFLITKMWGLSVSSPKDYGVNFLQFGAYALGFLTVTLCLLNGFYILNLLLMTKFFQSRRYPFFWALPALLILTVSGLIVALASFLGQSQ
jgi:hypothetical protein